MVVVDAVGRVRMGAERAIPPPPPNDDEEDAMGGGGGGGSENKNQLSKCAVLHCTVLYLHEFTMQIISTFGIPFALLKSGFPRKDRCFCVGDDATVIVPKGFCSW